MSSVALHACSVFPLTPKSFPQHISSCRSVAISIPVVRLRCSEQRITGVVNKLLPRSRLRGSYCSLLYFSKSSYPFTTLPPSRSRGGCFFAFFLLTLLPSRERIPSPNAKRERTGIGERTSACTAMLKCLESGEGISCDGRRRKTRNGFCLHAGIGAP